MTDLELFKQALSEGVSRHFDKLVLQGYREELIEVIREVASEYEEEFSNAVEGEIEGDFYTYVGDKHYFEFEKRGKELVLLNITDIVYFD